MNRPVVVFGARGQIGGAIDARLRPRRTVRIVAHDQLAAASAPLAAAAHDLVFAGGLTNHREGEEAVLAANLGFVQQVTASAHPDSRVITFGTIHEAVPGACEANAYLRSKRALGLWMAEHPAATHLHLRLHTIYSDIPKAHMFLGQLAHALRDGTPFRMSHGRQLREYHHADDIAMTVERLLARDFDALGSPVAVTTGDALRLVDLATAVFDALGDPALLEVGALPAQPHDNLDRVFERSPDWMVEGYRPAIPGVIEALADWLGRPPR